MTKFEDTYNEIMEMMCADALGAGVGDTGGSVGNVDSYATGDSRIPSYIGAKKRRKKKKKGEVEQEVEVTPIQRRVFPSS